MTPKTEPVMTFVAAELASVGGLLAAFDIHITGAQWAAVSNFVWVSVAFGLWVRSKVTPAAKLPPQST